MIWRIDTFCRKELSRRDIASEVKDFGVDKNVRVYSRKVYLIEADYDFEQIQKVAATLLIDPVVEDYRLLKGIFETVPSDNQILIGYNPGVYDSVADSFSRVARNLSLNIKNVITARFYEFVGLAKEEIITLAPKILYNPLIEHVLDYEKLKDILTLDEFKGQDYVFSPVVVKILGATAAELEGISKQGCLSLSLEEMRTIQSYFKDRSRDPTDCELETLAALWSEHCAHQTFRGVIEYEEQDTAGSCARKETINNLLQSTIIKATRQINSAQCVSVFDDNSGVVAFNQQYNICFKVETHNHPSSLEPYGGASTGIGGVIRDILGTGCSARPVASLDVFCFSPWDIAVDDLPEGLLHPRRTIKGVVKGVRDYGNRMGIPTVGGAVLFDQRFLGNPLVYCGTLGIIPKDKSFKEVKPKDLVILCGAKTGRDGIHGATFSSQELDEQTVNLTSAVQIGNPIEEKKLTEAILRARDRNLFRAITDCGAGGLSSAVTELAQKHGVEVHLDKVPLKYRGLTYAEIWISESQERMVFFAPDSNLEELKVIFDEEDVELTVIGEVTDSRKLVLFYQNCRICELDMDFIFNPPKLAKKAVWIPREEKERNLKEKDNYNADLKSLLARPNIAAKDWVLREYDHEVQAGSVTPGLSGIGSKITVNDAAVLRPDPESDRCLALGVGINPFYSDIDPYWMAAAAIDEALRNVVSAGGSLDKTFILDNFSWGSPLDEKELAGLVRAAKACYDFSVYFGVPFISGKDSLYNEYLVKDRRITIPGTLLISAVSVITDWQRTLSSNFKQSGNLIYLVGFTRPEMGASEYYRSLNIKAGRVPKVDRKIARKIFEHFSKAVSQGWIKSSHDLSEGGLGVALAEMLMGADLGARIFLAQVPQALEMSSDELLFAESTSRFLVEVDNKDKHDFERSLGDIPFGLIGCVNPDKKLIVYAKDDQVIINLEVEELREHWLKTFRAFR